MKRSLSQLYNPGKYYSFECPVCRSTIPYLHVRIGFGRGYVTQPFQCETCKAQLCVSRTYLWCVFVSTLIGLLIAPTLLGIQPWYLFALVALASFPIVATLVGMYAKWLFPPRLKRYVPEGLSL